MIKSKLLKDKGVLIVSPEGPLAAKDFKQLAGKVDPYIEKKGKLHGLMIETKSFPGWKDIAGLASHFKFVRNHHRKIDKVAAVTDDGLLSVMPKIADHFVNAKVKHFAYDDKVKALEWIDEP